MAATAYPAPGTIRSIQRGVLSVTGSNLTATATVAAVNPAKARISFLGSSQDGTSSEMARVELTNSTTVTATRQSGSTSTLVSWELVEVY